MSNWNRVIKPIVVLCVICIVITGALAATNAATAPVIAEATAAAQNAARNELLPEAAGAFTKVDGIDVENVDDVYAADNGTGWVITSNAKGYGGTITVMSAFTPEGVIKQIKVTEAQETPGFGSNVTDTPSYWERYAGVDAGRQLVLDQDIDRHSGATISSKALIKAVNSAIEAYNAIP